MRRTRIIDALRSDSEIDSVLIQGWVRTRRDTKELSFVEVNDGTCLKNIQVIVESSLLEGAKSVSISTGSAVAVKGSLVESTGKGQRWEIKAETVKVIGKAEESYPLQKKRHSNEYLREIAHLRPRSNFFGCVFRIRNHLSYAVHRFFQDRKFIYVHTPIITSSDCEGAGELFQVTSLDSAALPIEKGEVNYAKDFFSRPTYLTVSGQFGVEAFALSLSNVYSFGPTFRAENSNTSRHASEFWMIEPEMAFCDLEGNIKMAEEFVKFLVDDVVENCADDLVLFERYVDRGLRERLRFVSERPFLRVSHAEAIEVLKASNKTFEYPIEEEGNLQSEHERYLTEEHFESPVSIYDFPRASKPFYMRVNDDEKTVRAMDVLVPGIGELIGGSQREERLDLLEENMDRHEIDKTDYWWYLDLRRYGTVPHSGFGLGFDRMLMFVTGVSNIRDVIPFPRTPGNAEF